MIPLRYHINMMITSLGIIDGKNIMLTISNEAIINYNRKS